MAAILAATGPKAGNGAAGGNVPQGANGKHRKSPEIG